MGRARFDALGFSRYAASCWIVAFHYYAAGRSLRSHWAGLGAGVDAKATLVRLFNFGALLTQYFFLLSGFVLASARLSSSRPDEPKPTKKFVAERLATTYPLYLLALTLMLFYVAGGQGMAYAYPLKLAAVSVVESTTRIVKAS